MCKGKLREGVVVSLVILSMLLVTGCGLFNRAPEIDRITSSNTNIATGGSSTIECFATDPDGDTLTYTWTATGGTVSGSGSTMTWIAPTVVGSYTISVAVSDGKNQPVSDSITIKIANAAPHIASLTPSETSLAPRVSCTVTCTASDPDGDALTYTWTAADGVISGSGSTITWEAPEDEGSYTISVTVSDGKGGMASDSYTFEVEGNFGVIEIESDPTGATVYLEGEDTGNITPCTITNLEPGSYNVRLALYHYKYREQVVTVEANETTYVNWSLTSASGKMLTIQFGPAYSKDAFVSSSYSSFNFGVHGSLIAGSRDAGTYRAYLQFNLPEIPDGAIVKVARLGLCYYDNVPAVEGSIGVYAVEGDWNEGDITWENQPPFASTPEYIYNLPSSAGYIYVYWDISDLAQGWLDGSIPNYGVMLKNPEESNWQAWKYFRTSDYYSLYFPKLIIYYYDPMP